ncbi:AI-2E family transporter [Halomarina litorea]|uniref:AI-2E family transporter n=1 Tax=Halomarina litorea TaxID=2961595 RepID=UPI0020C528DA|nr:AI-2E family transporter [Halomarina sp. BCD28]
MRVDILSDGERARVAWWLFGLALFLVLSFVVGAFLGTFVLGLFLYYATRPVYDRLDDRVRPPSLAAAVALLALAVPIVVLVAYTSLVAFRELSLFVGTQQTGIAAAIEPYLVSEGAVSDPADILSSLVEDPGQLTSIGGSAALGTALTSLAGALSVVLGGALQLFIALAFAFYLLRDDRRLAAWTRARLTDGSAESPIRQYARAVDRDLKTIYFGNILNAFAIAVIAAVSYNLINVFAPPELLVPSPTLLGALTGVGSLIPVVGMKIVYVPVTVVLTVQAFLTDPALLWVPLVFAAISLVIVDTIPDFLLRPYVSGRNLHTGSVMFAYILGPILFGWYGLFLGPLLLVLVFHFVRLALPGLVRGHDLTTRTSESVRDTTRQSNFDRFAVGESRDRSSSRGSGEPNAGGPATGPRGTDAED